MEKVTFDVKGMSCMGCVNNVKGVLSDLAGVGEVDVVLEAGKVTVDYDPTRSSLGALKDAIEGAGFDVVG